MISIQLNIFKLKKLCLFYPLVDRYLGCFHVLAIVNSAAVNIRVPVSFQISIAFFPDVYPGMELMDHMELLLLVF